MTSASPPLAHARLAALSVALLLAACGGPAKVKPTQVNASLVAAAEVNRSESGRPSPLQLRVYELKSVAAFNSADFMSLYQRDQAELAADLVGKEEYRLEPGESKAFSKTLAPETRFLGVLASYRDVEHAKWRSVVTIQPQQTQQVNIRAGALAVEATSAPAGK